MILKVDRGVLAVVLTVKVALLPGVIALGVKFNVILLLGGFTAALKPTI